MKVVPPGGFSERRTRGLRIQLYSMSIAVAGLTGLEPAPIA